jgi:hypothetical protein
MGGIPLLGYDYAAFSFYGGSGNAFLPEQV